MRARAGPFVKRISSLPRRVQPALLTRPLRAARPGAECVKVLLDAKADATMKTLRTGLNALHYACSDQAVAHLRDAGASITDQGRPPSTVS